MRLRLLGALLAALAILSTNASARGTDIIRVLSGAPHPDLKSGKFMRVSMRVGTRPCDSRKGWFGAKIDSIDRPLAIALGLMSPSGALVTELTPGGPASQSELRAGDVVVSMNDQPIADADIFRRRISRLMPGSQATVEVWRYIANDRDFVATLHRLAGEGNNAAAMFRLGLMHANGSGVANDDTEAVRWFRKGANAGHPGSMIQLAFMILDARGAERNMQEALQLIRSAADSGNPDALWHYGLVLLNGKLTGKDALQALQYFERAAAANHSPSMLELGLMYSHANGIPRDFEMAARWYQKGASLNNAAAMVNLGVLYQQGNGVNQSDTEAADLYRRAAEVDQPAGLRNLAAMLDNGRGVPERDPEQAADLMMRALSLGNKFAYEEMTRRSGQWSREFRMALQRRLRDESLYNGDIDGGFGYSTNAAITTLFNRNC